MLHVDRAWHPAALWAHDGFPPIDGGAPVHGQLYFALTELAAAADAGDEESCDDLMLEVEVLADLLIRTESVRGDQAVTSVVVQLWGELQHAAGSLDLPVVATQAVLLRKLLPTPDRSRGRDDVPPYVPVMRRLGSGGSSLAPVTGADDPVPDDPAAAFLHALAAALATGRAHLTDLESGLCPQDSAPPRVGWASDHQSLGPSIGALSLIEQVMVLDPHGCVQTVRSIGLASRPPTEVAELLAGRWLMDSTLVVDEHRVQREPAVTGREALTGLGGPAWVWRMPTRWWASTQFTDGPRRLSQLRVVPNPDR